MYIYMTHTYTQPEFPRREFEVVAMYNRPSPIRADELPLIKGKKLTVLDSSKGDRWFARNQQG